MAAITALQIPKFAAPPSVRWRAFERGPEEQWLRCRGSGVARLLSWLHFHWPTARGQWRFMRFLEKHKPLASKLRAVPFVSSTGVEVHLDILSQRFLFLSGRLSPEPFEVALLSSLVQPGDTFVDVGAHWGLYLLHVLGRVGSAGRYYAIEPSPESLRFLSTAYRPREQLRVIPAAIADYDGSGSMIVDGNVNDHLANGTEGSTRVDVMRLDTLLADSHPAGRIFVKVDTEGHEAAVVRGCAGLAAAGIRPVFMVEFLNEMHGQTRQDVMRAFTETFGPVYDFRAIDASSGALRAFSSLEELGGDIRNMLAVPRP